MKITLYNGSVAESIDTSNFPEEIIFSVTCCREDCNELFEAVLSAGKRANEYIWRCEKIGFGAGKYKDPDNYNLFCSTRCFNAEALKKFGYKYKKVPLEKICAFCGKSFSFTRKAYPYAKPKYCPDCREKGNRTKNLFYKKE